MKSLTRGAVAKQAGLGIEAIRFYEQKGLIPSPARSESGYRQYSADIVRRLGFIRRAKELGFSLKEIKKLIELYDAPEGEGAQLRSFVEKIRARRSELLVQKDDIEHVLDELDVLEQRCTGLLEAEGDGG